MSEELIKRLRTEYTMCSIVDGLEDVAAVLRDAIDALSRPAPAVQVPEGELWSFLCRVLDEGAKLGRDFSGEHYYAFRDWTASEYVKKLAAAPTPAPVATEAVAQGGRVDVEAIATAVEGWAKEWYGADLDSVEREYLRDVIHRALLASPAVPVGDGMVSVPVGLLREYLQLLAGDLHPGAIWREIRHNAVAAILDNVPLPPAPAATKKEQEHE